MWFAGVKDIDVRSSEWKFEDFSFMNEGTTEVLEEIHLPMLSVATGRTWWRKVTKGTNMDTMTRRVGTGCG